MVWAMLAPATNSKWYLPGDLEGGPQEWRARLWRHYTYDMDINLKKKFRDAEDYVDITTDKFRSQYKLRQVYPLTAISIQNQEAPQFLRTTSQAKNLASVASLGGSMLIVDEHFKDIIEWVEPETHIFHHLPIKTSWTKMHSKRRYIFIINQYHDSFCSMQSKSTSFNEASGGMYGVSCKASDLKGITLRKSVFGSSHLWREQRFLKFIVCLSDRLQAELIDAGLRIPNHYRMNEI
jgi:hypothetical protein